MEKKRQQHQRKREEVEGRFGQRWFCFCNRMWDGWRRGTLPGVKEQKAREVAEREGP